MKVIEVRHNHYDTTEPNETPIGRVDCPKCGSTLEYSRLEIRPYMHIPRNKMYYSYLCITCPVCSTQIKLTSLNLKKKTNE